MVPPAAIPVAPETIALPPAGSVPSDHRPLAPVTTRVRRSITGTERIVRQAEPPSASSTVRAVACAGCHQAFRVIDRKEVYSVVCVHCGQINRVEPLT